MTLGAIVLRVQRSVTFVAWSAGQFRRGSSSIAEAFVLQVLAAGTLLLMHSVVAKTIGAQQYGIFSYAILVASLMTVVSTLGLPNGSLRYVAEYNERRDWAHLKGFAIRSCQLVLLGSLSAAVLLALIAISMRASQLAQGLLYGALLLPFVALGFWRSAAIRGLQRISGSILPEDVLRPILVIGACIVLSSSQFDLNAGRAIVLFVGATVVVLCLGFWWLVKALPSAALRVAPRYATKAWLATALPMLSGAVLHEVMARCDVFMLGLLSTMESTGLYSAAARVSLLNVFALKVVDTVVAPKIAAAFHGGRLAEMRGILKRGTLLSALGSVPLFMFMMLWPETMLSLFGPEFRQASVLLRILACGQLVSAMTGPVGYALLMTGHQRTFAKVVAIWAAFGLVGNAFLIPLWGAQGAAVVTSAGAVALNVSLYLSVRAKLARR